MRAWSPVAPGGATDMLFRQHPRPVRMRSSRRRWAVVLVVLVLVYIQFFRHTAHDAAHGPVRGTSTSRLFGGRYRPRRAAAINWNTNSHEAQDHNPQPEAEIGELEKQQHVLRQDMRKAAVEDEEEDETTAAEEVEKAAERRPLVKPDTDAPVLKGHDGQISHNALEGRLADAAKAAANVIIEPPRVLASPENGGKPVNREHIPKEASGDTSRFPPYGDLLALADVIQSMPDIIHHTFEAMTADVELEGWEDKWFSDAVVELPEGKTLKESRIDFVYTWVNGSDTAFQNTILPYEKNSTLNDPDGIWLESHRINRYRDWDELRYSIRTVEQYAASFRNKIQILVNAIAHPEDADDATVLDPARIGGMQRPDWLKDDEATRNQVHVIPQEEMFGEHEARCLPAFNSLTIENQIYNTKSDTDLVFTLSDDMFLGKQHAASDIHSPLFGPMMGFKSNSYNTIHPPTDADARRFGEKPFLIYTSWLLNRRFGERKRKGQMHFGHALSRAVAKEAITSFPRPAMQSACQRFRGEAGFQLYSWYAIFHYTMERHREALLWSYIMRRNDVNQDGFLGWAERQVIMSDLEEGMANEGDSTYRKRMFYHMGDALEEAGLKAPEVNVDIQWTSLDGPAMIKDIECFEFNVNECLAPGFSSPLSDADQPNYIFSTAAIVDRIVRERPRCGDCLLKLVLNRVPAGLSPLLPRRDTQMEMRTTVIKALKKYQYSVMDPDAYFVMVTDAEQVENVLFKRVLKKRGKVGQICLNDDVTTEELDAVANVRKVMIRLLEGMTQGPSAYEKVDGEMEAVYGREPPGS